MPGFWFAIRGLAFCGMCGNQNLTPMAPVKNGENAPSPDCKILHYNLIASSPTDLSAIIAAWHAVPASDVSFSTIPLVSLLVNIRTELLPLNTITVVTNEAACKVICISFNVIAICMAYDYIAIDISLRYAFERHAGIWQSDVIQVLRQARGPPALRQHRDDKIKAPAKRA